MNRLSTLLRNKRSLVGVLVIVFLIVTIFIIGNGSFDVSRDKNVPIPTPTLIPGEDYVLGQIVVKFKEGTTDEEINGKISKYGARVKSKIEGVGAVVIEVPEGKEQEIWEELSRDSDVEYSEPDPIFKIQSIPNDTNFDKQWGLSNVGQKIENSRGVPGVDINVVDAWDITKGSGVKVAIVDSGIDASHPDLLGKTVMERSFATSTAQDRIGHGTHIAGIIAAKINNNDGVAGVCPDCSLIVAKVVDENGSAIGSSVFNGITWAADSGAKVINISMVTVSTSQTLENVINHAWNKGAVIVAAAGNAGNSTKLYPAGLSNVISVANINNRGDRFSNSSYGGWVDIAAPGADIYSTLPTRSYHFQNVYKTSLNYDYLSGTSQASPHVAGVAALIWSTKYGTSNQAVVDRLFATADKISGTGTYWKYGRVNAFMAVRNDPVIPTTIPTIVPIPTLTKPPVSGVVPTHYCLGSCPGPTDPVVTLEPTLAPGKPSPTFGPTPIIRCLGLCPEEPTPTVSPSTQSKSGSGSTNSSGGGADQGSVRRAIYESINKMFEELNKQFPFLNLQPLLIP